MSEEITINSRIINKHDTEAKWNTKTDFIPEKGETIVYDIDSTHDYERMKIGDGVTTINNLPFQVSESELKKVQQQILQVGETQPSFACTWFRITT
jgi:hypothetical protein